MGQCNFYASDRNKFASHITTVHPRALWDGYCQICEGQIKDDDVSLLEELHHMALVHINRSNIVVLDHDNDQVDPQEPQLKIKKLDVLLLNAQVSYCFEVLNFLETFCFQFEIFLKNC